MIAVKVFSKIKSDQWWLRLSGFG